MTRDGYKAVEGIIKDAITTFVQKFEGLDDEIILKTKLNKKKGYIINVGIFNDGTGSGASDIIVDIYDTNPETLSSSIDKAIHNIATIEISDEITPEPQWLFRTTTLIPFDLQNNDNIMYISIKISGLITNPYSGVIRIDTKEAC